MSLPPSNASGDRQSYNSELYVERPVSPGRGDAALEQIADWLDSRLGGSRDFPICKLEAPPGYGKSWALARFVETNRGRFESDGPWYVYMVGPTVPPAPPTHGWWRPLIESSLCGDPYHVPQDKLRDNPNAAFGNLVVALVEDLEKHSPRSHLLMILDDLDRLENLQAVEAALLRPLANLSRDHNVSILIAVRNDFRFTQVEELRQATKTLAVPLVAFEQEQARRQFERLAVEGEAAVSADRVFAALPAGSSYTWGIPALNAELAAAVAAGEVPLSGGDIEQCLAGALRLDVGAGRDLFAAAQALTQSALPDGWTLEKAAEATGKSQRDAAALVKQLRALDLIERRPNSAFNTWQLIYHWNSVFEILLALQRAPDPLR